VAARVFPNRYLLTLADGCGFGHRSRVAAIAACHAFLDFMCSYQFRAPNGEALAKGLLRGVQMAHDKVFFFFFFFLFFFFFFFFLLLLSWFVGGNI
jgi:hypothetical protein